MASSTTTPATTTSTARFVVKPTQPAKNPRPAALTRDGLILAAVKPRSAGTRVTAMRTATTTVPAAHRPMTVRKGIPVTLRPASATTTVLPAKTTAIPAVPVALEAASSGDAPLPSSSRKRWTMKSA